MTHIVLSQVVASISELKKNPMGTVAAGGGLSVAIPTATSRLFIASLLGSMKP